MVLALSLPTKSVDGYVTMEGVAWISRGVAVPPGKPLWTTGRNGRAGS